MPTHREDVEIVVSAKDEATKTMRGIGSSISTAIGTFAGGAALNLATSGFQALSSAVAGGISDARDAAQVFAQTQAVIASTGGAAGFTAEQIADMAGSLSAASGASLFGDDDIQRGQNMLLTFTNIKETLPDATQTMLDMAQALGTDAGGAAVQLGKALNDPIAGISALSRVGVTFTEEQKAQIATMVEAGDVAGAQTVILAELNKEFGGSAQAAATANGGWAQLNDQMGELVEGIGARLLPALNGVTAWASSILSAFETGGFSGVWAVVQPQLVELGTSIANWISEQGPILVAQLLAWGKAFAAWVVDAVPPMLVQLRALATAMLAWVVAELPGWTAQLKTFGAAAAQWVLDALPGLAANLGTMAGDLLAWIVQTIGDVVPVLAQLGLAFVKWVALDVLPALPGALATVLDALITFISSAAREVVPVLAQLGAKFVDWIKTSVLPALPGALDAIKSTIGGWISGALSWAGSALYNLGAAIVQGLIDGLESMLDRARMVLNTIIEIINKIPIIPDIPAVRVGSNSSGSGGASFGGSSITINQTFAGGTSASTRQAARLGAVQGLRAAARSQGVI
jgi:hypothetical protein